jgi:hypothetical protein
MTLEIIQCFARTVYIRIDAQDWCIMRLDLIIQTHYQDLRVNEAEEIFLLNKIACRVIA